MVNVKDREERSKDGSGDVVFLSIRWKAVPQKPIVATDIIKRVAMNSIPKARDQRLYNTTSRLELNNCHGRKQWLLLLKKEMV